MGLTLQHEKQGLRPLSASQQKGPRIFECPPYLQCSKEGELGGDALAVPWASLGLVLQKALAANEACKATHLSAFATMTAISCWRVSNTTDVVSRQRETPSRDIWAAPPDKTPPSVTPD